MGKRRKKRGLRREEHEAAAFLARRLERAVKKREVR